MAIVRSSRANRKLKKRSKKQLVAARVIDIVLDNEHPFFEKLGFNDSIGTIFYTIIDQETPLEIPKISPTAKPLFSFVKSYPLINEIVLIMSTYDKEIYDVGGTTTYYLPNVNIWNHPHHNALPSLKDLDLDTTSNDYERAENGTPRRELTDEGSNIPLGKYFNEQLDLKPLLPYEGDIILEGRFGNSIRFGSTNFNDTIPENLKNPWSLSDTSQTGDPITLIRNGQSNNLDEKGWIHTVENINDDFSSIYLTSNQQITNLQVISTNISSYEAEEEPVDNFDPIRFEGLNRQDGVKEGTSEITVPISQPLPSVEEPILIGPTLPEETEVETPITDIVETDPDYNDSNKTENENRTESDLPDPNTITSDNAPEFDLNELMG